MRCCLLGKIPQAHNINSEFFMPNATPPQFLKFFFPQSKNEAIDKLEPQISYYCEFFKHISSFCGPKPENILHILQTEISKHSTHFDILETKISKHSACFGWDEI